MLAPHFYCPGVSLETRKQCYSGTGQWQGFDNTVGYLTVAPGFCANNGKCKVRRALCTGATTAEGRSVAGGCTAKVGMQQPVAGAVHTSRPGASCISCCEAQQRHSGALKHAGQAAGGVKLKSVQVFAAIVDEFGSTLNSTIEDSCMSSILSYMAVAPGTGKHAPFTSWFYWCARWQVSWV